MHTPEYAFEKVPGNVAKGAANLGISYPIALDNNYATWTNYRNRYWPAEYLIDATGTVRHIKFGEGDYNVTETLVRQLLNDAKPGVKLPSPAAPPRPTLPRGPHLLPETYFGVGKVVNYGGGGAYDEGSAVFDYPPSLAANSFALRGRWALDYQGATSDGNDAAIKLNYHAKDVYIVVGGTGTLTVVRDGNQPHYRSAGRRPPIRWSPAIGWRPKHLRCGPARGYRFFPSPTDEYPSKTRTAPKKSCRG